jgi:hypothetical protein
MSVEGRAIDGLIDPKLLSLTIMMLGLKYYK